MTAVKALDVSNMDIVLRGKQWDRIEDPCAKNVIHLLERNEGLVTWLQPKVSLFFFYLFLGLFIALSFGRAGRRS